MADNFGLKIGIDGEKQFKQSLADINSSFKVLGSEMKLATSQFDKNEQSVKALTAKNDVLAKQIDTQKSKVQTLRDALKNMPKVRMDYRLSFLRRQKRFAGFTECLCSVKLFVLLQIFLQTMVFTPLPEKQSGRQAPLRASLQMKSIKALLFCISAP